jgi:hypothetical protein
MTILNYIRSLFSSTNNELSGADAVRTAVQEIEDLLESQVDATVGEPDIVEGKGRYFNDAQILVPVYDIPLIGDKQLLFDLPEGADDELSQFNQLLDLLGADFETMEDIEGETVPVEFHGGNPFIAWDQMDSPEEPDTDDGDTDKVADEDGSGVNVEETTISAEGDDD